MVLFDSSGGRGLAPVSWPAPLPGTTCGYAGGLGPDTLTEQLPLIHTAANGRGYWIDMEGRLRTPEDRFDLDRARRCLEIVADFHRSIEAAMLSEDQARKRFAAYFSDLQTSMATDGGAVDEATEWERCIEHWICEGAAPAEAIYWKCPRSINADLQKEPIV